MKRSTPGMTLVELLVALTLSLIVLAPVLSLLAFASRQWGMQASSSLSMQAATLALDQIEKKVRNAVSFSAITVSGNTLYTFTMPGATDSSGNYVPVIVSTQGSNVAGVLGYSAGSRVAYYLSDTTGGLSILGGATLWRATMAVGSSSWTPSTSWSLNSANQPRYGVVQSFTITPIQNLSGYANSVQISISVRVTEGQQSRTYTLTRQVYLMNSGL